MSTLGEGKLYYSLRDYFLEKYGTRVQKITVALPFTCPNIDGSKGRGGCIYCYAGSIPPNLSPTVPLRKQIEEVLEHLNDREKEVIKLRFGLTPDKSERTLEEIGQELKVTRERVRQIESSAIKKLRHPNIGKILKKYMGI